MNSSKSTDAAQYEVRQTGPENIRLETGATDSTGAAETLDIDGFSTENGNFLEAKYVGKAERSPYVQGSRMPAPIRAKIDASVEKDFARYGRLIENSGNPGRALTMITNDERAVPYFVDMLNKLGIRGRVVVQP